MKILPDYLIKAMPEIESAAEELRLSVLDHAYDLIKCLDIDELDSDDIRKKLELYNLSAENMDTSWLPNGRFYRMYPLIKYDRTRLNDLQSIVKSGGQFEGLWSDDYTKNSIYDYRLSQTLRHYMMKSPFDGYFYISGNIKRTRNNANPVLLSLSSDILINQVMPAGYTYLYLPWPSPLYPSESGYEYNVHMLMFDRLHCNFANDGIYYYDCSVPASSLYTNNSNQLEQNKGKTPYWFDYHFTGYNSDNPKAVAYIPEHGEYITEYNDTAYDDEDREITKYHRSQVLNNSNTIFPTTYYSHSLNKTRWPNSKQTILGVDSYDADLDKFISKNVSIDSEHHAYRFDLLSKFSSILKLPLSHIKTYQPLWNSSSYILDTLQKSIPIESKYSSLHPDSIASRSLYNIFNLKESNNEQSIYGLTKDISGNEYIITDNIVRTNKPPVSEITHTSYDRPVIGHLDPIYIEYLRPSDDEQGENKSIDNTVTNNILYELYSPTPVYHNPILNYNMISLGVKSDNKQINNKPIGYLSVDPATNILYINKYDDPSTLECNYVTYKTSYYHKLWLSHSRENTALTSSNTLYNYLGSKKLLVYTNNIVKLTASIKGIFTSDNTEIHDSNASIECFIYHDSYSLNFKPSLDNYEAAYILCKLNVTPGITDDKSPTVAIIYNIITGEKLEVDYLQDERTFNVGSEYLTREQLYERNYIVQTSSRDKYFGTTEVEVIEDSGV